MKIDPVRDHGRVVWAHLKRNSPAWSGIIISTQKLDLTFKEKARKTWIYWLADYSLSNVENNYIYDLTTDYEKHTKNLTGNRKKGVLEAIEILAHQFNILIPHDLLRKDESISWAGQNMVKSIQNQMGKLRRHDEYFIPQDILKIIRARNSTNISEELHTSMEISANKKSSEQNPRNNKKIRLEDCCIGCRNVIVGIKAEHPLFEGPLCELCRKRVESFILSISSKDSFNDVCCICCVKDESYKVVLCSRCVYIYCVKCVSHFCGKSGFTNVVNTKNWNCFACCYDSKIPTALNRKSTDEQLNNIYKLCTPVKNGIKAKLYSIPKLNVIAVKDKHSLVCSILNDLNYPFNLIDENIFETNQNDVDQVQCNLLIRYCHITDQEMLESTERRLEFYNYFYIKDKIETISLVKGTPFFWAYECSSAIPFLERQRNSRFLESEPILISQGVKNVRERGRLLWTNIFLRKDDVRHAQKHNILLQKYKPTAVEKDTPLSYSSIHLLLSSLIRNHIQKE